MTLSSFISSFKTKPTTTSPNIPENTVQTAAELAGNPVPPKAAINTLPTKSSKRWTKDIFASKSGSTNGNLQDLFSPPTESSSSSSPHLQAVNPQDLLIKVMREAEQLISTKFAVVGIEPTDSSVRQQRTLEEQRKLYQWQEPRTVQPSYPPCLKSIPKSDKVGLLQIFNPQRFVDTAIVLKPELIQLPLLSRFIYGDPFAKTMAGLEQRMRALTREKKNIGSETSIANRDDWYADAVFAQQSFTGPNPTSIANASAEWIERFERTARAQGQKRALSLLKNSNPESFYIQDYSSFRYAAGAPPNSDLVSENGHRFGCAAVTLFQLTQEGKLHPLAIVLDYRVSMEDSVVIFNQRLSPSDPTSTEAKDWPWRYAKLCNQVSDWMYHEGVVHLNNCHLVEEATIVAASRSFTSDHIVWRLLEPHWLKTLSLNAAARSILVPEVINQINGFTHVQTFSIIQEAYKSYNWTASYIPADLKRRGFPLAMLDDQVFHNYAWARNMVPMWHVIHNFVSSVLATVYKTDFDVAADKSVASWCAEMHSSTGGQMLSFAHISTIEELTNAVVMCIHIACPQHNSVNYLQCYYMSFVPNKPASLMAPLPRNLEDLMRYKERDMMAALPEENHQIWLLSSQLPYLLSYGAAEDQTLVNYAQTLQDEARLAGTKGDEEKWGQIQTAARTFYADLLALGETFNANSEQLDDTTVPYHVMDPTKLAVSILI